VREYLDWPHEISIETYSKCNAACTFCPYPTLERQGTKLSDDLIDRIIEELKDHPHPFIISPFKVNEPFLDKRLIPICRKIEAELPQAWLRLFTNGSALTERHIREVSGLQRIVHLWISLNEHRPTEYASLMSLSFERTAANLDRLHQAVADGFPHEVVVSRVMSGGCKPDADDDAFAQYMQDRWPLFQPWLIKRDGWIDYISQNDAPVPATTCVRWYELSIMANGKVAMCCMDGEGKYQLGDLNKQTLFEVYNGRQWRNRRLLESSRLDVGKPCSGCNY